ncbi:MAG: hypothetical protein PHG02_07005 [Oscillospiraceae bacterium]|nr:hypothetical protein [Oscillospiraceae bacterium]
MSEKKSKEEKDKVAAVAEQLKEDAPQPEDLEDMSLEEREIQLSAREARLAAKEKELAEKGYINYKEKMYDKININVKTLDKVIIGLVVLTVLVIIAGIVKGNIG